VPRRRDPSDFLPLKTDVVFIMLSLAAGARHGYGIIRDVEARSDGEVRLQTGALYRTLRRLLNDALIEDERRRYYRVTPFGRAVLDADVARMVRVVRAARHAAPGKRPHPA
jgi:DNA-binding PadR family transcriptional regulator